MPGTSFSYMEEKVSNSLAMIGGSALPLLAIPLVTIFQTIILAAIGAITGLITKMLFEWIIKKLRNGKA